MRKYLLILLVLVARIAVAAPLNHVTGHVRDAASGQPIGGAVVRLDDGAAWAVADMDGKYTISLPNGKYLLTAECLGYVAQSLQLVSKNSGVEAYDLSGRKVTPDFNLEAQSLALNDVVVTAKRPAGTIGTSHSIGQEALRHLQMSDMANMTALLPGGKTTNPDLTQNNAIVLRDGGTQAGNAAFGTALEVDGVRIGNNAAMGELAGVGTRSVAVENIESIEVITGIPSAEYGDLNSGMVKVHTKRGRSPLNIVFSVNPRTYQGSLSKGFGFKKDGGVLNVSAEWARATTKITSPYTSYTRRTIGAVYSNTFKKNFRYEAGLNANIGGMNAKDDPDANNGNTESARDNNFRFHSNLNWMLNKSWITSLKADASVSFSDNLNRSHVFNTSASPKPAIHSEEQGYHFATPLPLEYYADRVVDSKELDFAAALKYDWTRTFGSVKNRLKAGVQFKSEGNIGRGEYYQVAALAPNGYRPRPYSQYPFMNNFSEYIEDQVTLPVGNTSLEMVAGLRFEQVYIKGSDYKKLNTLSPRLNMKWDLGSGFTVRGGWGVNQKLPSFWVLFPRQEYRDIQTFAFSTESSANYVYYTHPFAMVFNPDLRWQKNYNSELGFDFKKGGWELSVVAFYNKTVDPYQYQSVYTPVSVNMQQVPGGFVMPQNPQFKVDSQTGEVFIRPDSEEYWTPMENKLTNRTFVRSDMQTNGKPVHRAGVELTLDCPQIKAIRTSFRVDAKYSFSTYVDDMLTYYYNTNWSHTSIPNMSYQYVGVYARGANGLTANGKTNHTLDANITSITHIPEARLVFTLRLETSILRRSRNLSQYQGKEYAYNVSESSNTPTGGSIYDGNSYAAIRPVSYMTVDGVLHPFTDAEAADPEFAQLIVKTGNAYTFNPDGYGFYCSANFSITKEIGKHVALSLFANNFTATRPAVPSMATGVKVVFTPSFYYGLTCRLKF